MQTAEQFVESMRQDATMQGFTEVNEIPEQNLRPMESNTVEVGDVFEIAKDAQLYSHNMGVNKAYFFVVTTGSGVRRFYPTSLRKRVLVYNADGKPTNTHVVATGDASEEAQKLTTLKDLVELVKGKKIRVENLVPTCIKDRNNPGKTTYTNIGKFVWA